MTYPATNSKEASELLIDVSNQMHEIVNEDATTEVMTESGLVPSVRKALADTFLFQDPIAWNQGSDETAFNQLRTFNGSIYWAPTATTLNPIPMGATPIGDSNWKLAPVDVSREWTLQELTRSQNEVIGGKIFPLDDAVLQNGDTVPAGTTHLRVDIGGEPTIVAMSPVASGNVGSLTETGATIGATSVIFIPFKSSFTFRFGSIANMLAGIPVRSEVGDICIVLDTIFKHESGSGFTITDFKPLSYRGGEAYEKTTIESLRNELSGVVDPTLLQYGCRKQINNPDFTDTIEDVANFAGQTLGAAAPIGWIHHHYTDGIMHQWDNVGDGTILFLKNAQNPGRRPDKDPSYVGQGKFLSIGTEGFIGAGSERMFLSKDAEWVYRRRQPAFFFSDLDPADGDGFAFNKTCYRGMELVEKWRSGGVDLAYVRNASGTPQIRLFKNGAFATDGTVLDLNTQSGGVIRIVTGPRSDIAGGAGDLKLSPGPDDANNVIHLDGGVKLKQFATASLPVLAANERGIAWDSTLNALVKWDGTSWSAV
uniref:Tail fiber protein n=1 Tax=Vibrio phage P018-4 TaxID=3229728 RepID=A0AB39AJ89_9CAUD